MSLIFTLEQLEELSIFSLRDVAREKEQTKEKAN